HRHADLQRPALARGVPRACAAGRRDRGAGLQHAEREPALPRASRPARAPPSHHGAIDGLPERHLARRNRQGGGGGRLPHVRPLRDRGADRRDRGQEPDRGRRGHLLQRRHRSRRQPEEDHVQFRRAPAPRALQADRRKNRRRSHAGQRRLGSHPMHIELASLPQLERYKLLIGLVIPRPIGWVSTWNENGVANCAPFSFFNVISEDPPLCILSFNWRSDGTIKHTLKNIRRTGEYVVNLVDESTANAMHVSSYEIPETESEFAKTGLTPVPAKIVKHP